MARGVKLSGRTFRDALEISGGPAKRALLGMTDDARTLNRILLAWEHNQITTGELGLVLVRYNDLDASDQKAFARILRVGGDEAVEGAAKLDDAGFDAVVRADVPVRTKARAIEALDGTNPRRLAVSTEGQELALQMVADGGDDIVTFLRKAEVCNSPCDKIPDVLLDLRSVEGLTDADLATFGRQLQTYSNDVGIDTVEDFAGDLRRLANAGDNGEPIEGFGDMVLGKRVQPGHGSEVNLKGLVGEVDAATDILDNDARFLARLNRKIDTPTGSTDIDLELADGTAIEVKNIDYADISDFLRDRELNDLETKIQRYAAVRDEIIIATRTSDTNLLKPLRNTIESAHPDTNVQIKNIEDLTSN